MDDRAAPAQAKESTTRGAVALLFFKAAKRDNAEVSAASVTQTEGGACASRESNTPAARAAARTTSGCSLKSEVEVLPDIGFDVCHAGALAEALAELRRAPRQRRLNCRPAFQGRGHPTLTIRRC